MKSTSVDVAVIGAGLAGLVCARRLAQGGCSVTLLEASERVGGRTLGRRIGAAMFDLGGQWIGPGQTRVHALAEELGLATFPTAHAGRHLLSIDGRVRTFRGTIPLVSPRALAELGLGVARTYGMSWRVTPELLARGVAARYDALAVEDLAGALRTPAGRGLFDAAFRTVFGAEARDVSLLWYLFYARAGGGFFRLVDVDGGAQERRFVAGAAGLATTLAAQLGEALTLGAPVRRITQEGPAVLVQAEGVELYARHAVVAVPLTHLPRITFDPPLPAERAALAQSARMGATVKVHALYSSAFWRARGLSGQVVANQGPLSVVFDNSTHDGAQAALVGFIVGDEARRWASRRPEDQRGALLDQLAALFGAAARTPVDLVTHDWSTEAWVGGCPVASPPPGVLAGRAASLRAPHGRVHWAGTETATRHPGYLDGAVSSGERAAREVLAARDP